MPEVRHTSIINAPREKVFAYVDDYRNVPEFMQGVTSFALVGEQVRGVGAKYDSVMKVGPKDLKSILECTEWIEGEHLRMESTSGFPVVTNWVFTDGAEPDTTEMSVAFEYQLPGGLAGRALKAIIEPFAKSGVGHTEKKVREAVEG